MITYDVWETGFSSLGVGAFLIIMTYGTYLVFKTPMWNEDAFLALDTWKSIIGVFSLVFWAIIAIVITAFVIGNFVLLASEIFGFINVPQ